MTPFSRTIYQYDPVSDVRLTPSRPYHRFSLLVRDSTFLSGVDPVVMRVMPLTRFAADQHDHDDHDHDHDHDHAPDGGGGGGGGDGGGGDDDDDDDDGPAAPFESFPVLTRQVRVEVATRQPQQILEPLTTRRSNPAFSLAVEL
eukprot:2958771-Rhodomonas_salina.3